MPLSSGRGAGAAFAEIVGKAIVEARNPARTTSRVPMVPPAHTSAGKTPRPAEAGHREPKSGPRPDTTYWLNIAICLAVHNVRLRPDPVGSVGPFSYRVEELGRSEEDLSAGHRRRAECVIVEIVFREYPEDRTCLDHARHAVFVRHIDL